MQEEGKVQEEDKEQVVAGVLAAEVWVEVLRQDRAGIACALPVVKR